MNYQLIHPHEKSTTGEMLGLGNVGGINGDRHKVSFQAFNPSIPYLVSNLGLMVNNAVVDKEEKCPGYLKSYLLVKIERHID